MNILNTNGLTWFQPFRTALGTQTPAAGSGAEEATAGRKLPFSFAAVSAQIGHQGGDIVSRPVPSPTEDGVFAAPAPVPDAPGRSADGRYAAPAPVPFAPGWYADGRYAEPAPAEPAPPAAPPHGEERYARPEPVALIPFKVMLSLRR